MTLSLPAVMMTFFMGSCRMVRISETGWACQWCMRCGVVEAPILTSHTHTHPSKPAKQFHCLLSVLVYIQSLGCLCSATHPSILPLMSSSNHALIDPSSYPSIHSFIHPVIHPFIFHPPILSFNHALIHSLTQPAILLSLFIHTEKVTFLRGLSMSTLM